MYAPSYGFGPANPQTQPFNPNGGAPQPHPLNVNPHQQQPGPGQQPQHMYPQQQQQQQYAVPGPQHQPSPYGGAPGPGMGGNAGGMGMMPSSGMAQMGGGVPAYQTPYSSSPYGASIPTSSSNLPPNFMPTSSGAPSFPMNAPNMNHPQQHQVQRMQPPHNASTPTQSSGPRASPFGGVPHNTPPNAASAQSQFSTPQNSNQTHLQTPNNNQQSHGGTIITPQTPNFPPGSQGGNAGSSIASPLSPGSEAREKERVTLLLDINRVLLLEAVSLHALQAEAKKEESKENTASPDGSNSGDKDKADKSAIGKEYVECMRRLQSNLAYLAAIADRSHKPSSLIPPHPAIMHAPAITTKPLKLIGLDSPSDETKNEDGEEKNAEEVQEEDRVELLKEQYKRLADLFPGVDIKKEAKQQQAPKQGDQNQQQKMQNDMLRQKMMQTQQTQQPVQNR